MTTYTKSALTGIVAIVLVVALAAALTYAALAKRWIFAGPTGAVEQKEITNRGAYRIQAYEDFYEMYNQVEEIKQKLANFPPSSQMNTRDKTDCRALLNRLAQVVSEYNAAADAERTRGQWRDPELPQRLEHTQPRTC